MIAIADVAVVVSDARASARWWRTRLGFATHTIGGSGHAVLVAPPGERFVLHLCEGFSALEPGNSGIAFVTDEIDALVARMRRAGVTFPQPLHEEGWGRSAKFADPDGNVFGLLGVPAPFVQRTLRLTATPRRKPSERPRPARGRARRTSRRAPGRRASARAASGS
ncbi:MAG: VOC family protein [Thermoplasmata archaeon]